MSYIEQQVEMLSEITEKPKDDILAEIQNSIKEGYSEPAAVMKWKSQHKKELGAGESKDFMIRVIGKGELREGDYGKYGYMGFLTYDGGVIETKVASFSSSSLPKRELLELGKVYQLKAFEKCDGTINRIKAIKEVDGETVPKVQELVAMDFKFKPLKDFDKYVGESYLFHGWVGRIIKSRDSRQVVGFEFGDEDTVIPATFWIHCDAEVPEIEDGSELFVYAYVGMGRDGAVGNASGIFKA